MLKLGLKCGVALAVVRDLDQRRVLTLADIVSNAEPQSVIGAKTSSLCRNVSSVRSGPIIFWVVLH